jgi:hypothetical protein
MQRRRIMATLIACAVILVLVWMVSIKPGQMLARGCPLTHKANQGEKARLCDSVTSHSVAGQAALTAFAQIAPEPTLARCGGVVALVRAVPDPSAEAPPLRC